MSKDGKCGQKSFKKDVLHTSSPRSYVPFLQRDGSCQMQLPKKTEASAPTVKLEAPAPPEAMDSGAERENKRIFSIRRAGRPKCVTARKGKQQFRSLVYTGAEASVVQEYLEVEMSYS